MNIELLREYCILKKGVTEEFPFDTDVLVFKVLGKIFLLTSLKKWEEGMASINVKCSPERAIELRETYESIEAGYHMSKKHWNTVQLHTGELENKLLFELIDHSYELIVKGLPKKLRDTL